MQRTTLHLKDSTLTPPNDPSGKSIWNDAGPCPITGCNADGDIGLDGIEIAYPDSLPSLHSGLVEIGGQQFKCATATFQAVEHDEQANFSKVLSGKENQSFMLGVRSWSPDEQGRLVNVETRVYWTKLISAQYVQFGVFAAAITAIDEAGSIKPSVWHDYSKGNSKGVTDPAGRMTSLKSSMIPPPGLGNASASRVQKSLLEL